MVRLVLVVLGILLLAAVPTGVRAHATLLSSAPASGAILDQSPGRVVLSFNEPTGLLAARLITPDGTVHDLTEFSASGTTLTIIVPDNLPQGTSVLSWRAASEDGHPIAGTVLFSVGAAGGAATELAAEDPLVAPLLWLARAMMFIGVIIGAGAGGYRMIDLALPRAAGLAATWLMALGFAGAGWSFFLHGLTLLGLPLSAVLRPEPWVSGLFSTYGATVIVLFSALLLGYIAVHAPFRRIALAAAILGFFAIGLATTLSGHASTAEPQWLMRTAIFVHVVCIAWWVGCLVPLSLVLARADDRAAAPLIRFSRWIPYVIAPLVVSGITLAIVQMGWPGPAWLTPYGYVLAGKLFLLLLLFSAASYNRWVLTAPAIRGETRALRDMRRTIVSEVVLVVAILALVAGWRFTPPPRAFVEPPPATETAIELAQGDVVATLTLAVPEAGPVSGTLALMSAAGEPILPRAIALGFSLPAAGVEEIQAQLAPAGDGLWNISAATLPLAGEWQVEVEVRISDFELARLRGTVPVDP